MISIKAAVIAASAVGAVAVSGVTWASVAQPEAAAPRSADGKLPAAVTKARQDAPKVLPSCLPASDLHKNLHKGLPEKGLTQRQAPNTGEDLPQPPAAGVPGKSHQPGPGEPRTLAAKPGATDVPNAPGTDLPVCPDGPQTDRKPGTKLPSPAVPSTAPKAPQVPDVTRLGCAKLAPAVEVGSALERTIMLSRGLEHASTKAAPRRLGAAETCSVIQKWVARAGAPTWITVERIRTPVRMTEQQVRNALEVSANSTRSTTTGGAVVLQAPGGRDGVLMIDPNGYALFVNGSRLAGNDLRDVTAHLSKLRG